MLLSIITINLNHANGLLNTAKSIANQTENNFEWIIIDGGSTDKSVEIIRPFQQYIGYWVSEPDKGIYNAMNKGIAQAKGDYILFLNSGDRLYDKYVVAKLSPLLKQQGVYYTRALLEEENKNRIVKYPKKLDIDFFLTNSLNHQNCIFKKSLFEKYGFYDEHYKICSDWDFTLQLFTHQEAFVFIEELIISCFKAGGISGNYKALEKERTEVILQKHLIYQERYQQLLIKKHSIISRLKNKIRRSFQYYFSISC